MLVFALAKYRSVIGKNYWLGTGNWEKMVSKCLRNMLVYLIKCVMSIKLVFHYVI